MSKVRNFAEIAPNIGFSEFDFYDLYRSTIEKSELGRIKKLLPLHEMAENFGLVSKSMRPKLMEQLNGNIHYQMFCDVIIDPTRPLANYKLLDDIMLELAGKLKIQQQQDILAEMWKPYMESLDTLYPDATCYESEMRYPTDPKLLWEGIEKSYETMCELSKRLGIHRPRTKFLDVQKANLTYKKQRKHSKSQTKKMTRRLIELLGKILKEIQQKNHFQSGDSRENIPDRIVSINKPYVRPIVRGKEVKSVEFGASPLIHKRLFGVDVKKIGGDTGYAGTENRNFCKENGIQTSFVKRGRPFSEEKKEKDLVRKELARVRATAMEGSFGTQKEHYDLTSFSASTRQTWCSWQTGLRSEHAWPQQPEPKTYT